MFWRCCILLTVVLLGGAFGATAQDSPPAPIMTALASVADMPEVAGLLSYVDYQALAALESGDPEDAYTQAIVKHVRGGPDLSLFMVQIDDQQRLIGVSPFEVAQGAAWGEPPAQGVLLQGAFNPLIITAALRLRDYSRETTAGLTLFCGPAGCDQGSAINAADREPGNPFGGNLGRQQPILLTGAGDRRQLISSASLEVVEQAIAAVTGTLPSLAQNPAYLTALHAVDAASLLQAHFIAPEMIAPAPATVEPLPPWELLMVSQTGADGVGAAAVTLTYATLAEAEAAAEVLERRIASYVTYRTDELLTDLLEERWAEVSFSAAADDGTGLASAQVVFRGPENARLYQLLVQSLYMRDLGWLAP